MVRIPMASAGDKGFASRRQGPREDLGPLPPDLCGDALEVRVECFGELLAGRLGPRRPEIPERLDPATAALLVVPEIQVWPSANRFRRHATTDLHGSDIRLTLLKVNVRLSGGMAGMAPPLDFHWKRSWRAGPFGWALDVLLVSLTADVGEISALFASAGHRIVDTIVQRRGRPDSRTFVGRGKLGEGQAPGDARGVDPGRFQGEPR